MKLTDTISIEFNNGYYEIQHEKTAKDTNKKYFSDKKTFAELSHLKRYLSNFGASDEITPEFIDLLKIESGIRQAKNAALIKSRNTNRKGK